MHWGSKECASVVITGILVIIRQGEVDNNELGKCDRCHCVEWRAWKWVPSLHLLFIYCFLLWLFVCDLSCPIREFFTQILRSRAGWRILLLCARGLWAVTVCFYGTCTVPSVTGLPSTRSNSFDPRPLHHIPSNWKSNFYKSWYVITPCKI